MSKSDNEILAEIYQEAVKQKALPAVSVMYERNPDAPWLAFRDMLIEATDDDGLTVEYLTSLMERLVMGEHPLAVGEMFTLIIGLIEWKLWSERKEGGHG